jgi:hypothetical protein
MGFEKTTHDIGFYKFIITIMGVNKLRGESQIRYIISI